jgi:hypothetical protein
VLAQGLGQLSFVSAGAFGSIVGGLATVAGSIQNARHAVDTFKEGFNLAKTGTTLAGIANMASGIGGIVTAAMAAAKAVGAIWNALDRNKGRDVVEDFAESMGGFDALHVKLLTLGAAGEELWIKLTQGVGRNNPAQAQAAIDEVIAAFDEQKRAQDAATVSTEEGAQATIETATQAALALDELSARLLTNASEWDAWSVNVTGFLQKLADDIRSMPMPGPSGYSVGSIPEGPPAPGFTPIHSFAPSSRSSGVVGGDMNITLTMPDGDVLLRQTVKAAKRNGLA